MIEDKKTGLKVADPIEAKWIGVQKQSENAIIENNINNTIHKVIAELAAKEIEKFK